jgi:glutamate-1-semialdehyde 2,1-aminomutase
MNTTLLAWLAGLALLGVVLPRVWARLQLSLAKHPSLAGHARLSRRLARLLPAFELEGEAFFAADGAPAEVVERRQRGFAALSALYRARFARTAQATADAAPGIPDLEFTGSYRVPWPFSRGVRAALSAGSFVTESAGVELTDLDGNRLYDLAGAYGVNLLGYDFYKDCMARGAERVAALGPVLGC